MLKLMMRAEPLAEKHTMKSRMLALLAPTLLALGIRQAAMAQIPTDSSTTETHSTAWNWSTRVQRSRVEANGRIIETQVVEAPSINGGYALQSSTERETIYEGPDTIRIVERWYAPDAEGHARLSRVTETRTTTAPGKSPSTSRVSYDAEWNGHLREMEREVQESVSLSASTKQTTSTLSLLRAGVISPVQRTVTVETLNEGGLTDIQRTVSFADLSGRFVEAQVNCSGR
jgi:hypothetical protein